MTRLLCLIPLFCVFSFVGCGESETTDAQAEGSSNASTGASAIENPEEELNAAVILVQFRGCRGAERLDRDRHEAKAMAEECLAKVSEGGDFHELAREYSDHPTAAAGGVLGNFKAGTELKPLVEATRSIKIGDISDPVETHYGYFIVKRGKVQELYNASHILLLHTDSSTAPKGLERTKEQTIELAQQILKDVKDGGNFNLLALRYSDGPGQKAGGQLGNFSIDQLPTKMRDVGHKVAGLEINEISDPFETEYGIHLVKRQALPKPSILMSAKHILVMHKESERSNGTRRTREEALTRMKKVQDKLMAGEDFSKLAAEYSDCPSASKGGDLGRFKTGQMAKPFEAAVRACTIGGCTDIVETSFGYHIIYRNPLVLRRK
ncbi:MAG: peptidylprolyl isomerase [Planctomycetaceae bacterium]